MVCSKISLSDRDGVVQGHPGLPICAWLINVYTMRWSGEEGGCERAGMRARLVRRERTAIAVGSKPIADDTALVADTEGEAV